MHKTRKEMDKYREHFQGHIFAVVEHRYGIVLTPETATRLVDLIKGLSPPERKLFWSDLAEGMHEDRGKLYKYYNNTFKPFLMPKFPCELLAYFGEVAYQTALQLLEENSNIAREQLTLRGVALVKHRVNFDQYGEIYHPDSAYHKIRNTLISTFQYWHENDGDARRVSECYHRRTKSLPEHVESRTGLAAHSNNV